METVYVVQREEGGIPDEPSVFIDEKKAEAFYIQMVNEDHEKQFTTCDEVDEFMMGISCDGPFWRIWGVDVSE